MATEIQTLMIEGQRFVIMPESRYHEILGDNMQPPLPKADAKGNYPAVASARVILARKLIRRRRAVGLTQKDLARHAGVRVETLNRLEHGKHSPNVATVDKLVRALDRAEGKRYHTK